MIEGDFRFRAGEVMLRASTGGFAFGPRGLPHASQNRGETPGRLLVVTTPSGLERFFEQFAELLPSPVGPDGLVAVGRANRIEFIGPPLAASEPSERSRDNDRLAP